MASTRIIIACTALSLVACGGGGKNTPEDAVGDGEEDAPEDVDTEEGGPTAFSDQIRVEPGAAYAIHIGPTGEITPGAVLDPVDELSTTSAEAVAAAPEWIRDDLARTLWHLDAAQADTFASLVLAAEAAQVDEVAWAIAVTAPEILEWMAGRGYANIFLENAQAIYAVDGQLLYARLVELEDRTTLEVEGEAGTYQLDPETYYWYVVYPRAYIGLPMYFDGEFWRTLFQLSTPIAPPIVSAVSTATTVQEAADMVGDWIQAIMTFGYGTNELQPVEIYQNRYGSCGQYSIITTAAAKTVFIPTASASARADDHEWNEFWDGRWIMWDNSLGEIGTNPHYPYIDWPDIMDDDLYSGSGVFGEVAHVLRFREDENIFPCEGYTGYEQQISITVMDSAGNPVEGARVVAYSQDPTFHPCTWSYTDQTGLATFVLGDGLLYGFTTDHPILGDFPRSSVDPSVRVPDGGGEPVAENVFYPNAFPRMVTDAGAPPAGELALHFDFAVDRTTQHRVNVITEGYDLGQTYPADLTGGVIDVFLVDQAGHDAFWAASAFDGHSLLLASSEGTADLTLPSGQDWYLILDNAWWPTSTKFVTISVSTGE